MHLQELNQELNQERCREEFLKQYYFAEEKERVIIVELKDGQIRKRKFNINLVKKENPRETYEFYKEQPSVTLNEDALTNLLTYY